MLPKLQLHNVRPYGLEFRPCVQWDQERSIHFFFFFFNDAVNQWILVVFVLIHEPDM